MSTGMPSASPRDYRKDRKDHWFVVIPAPVPGIIALGDNKARRVPANTWHIYDTKAGPGYGTLVYEEKI